MDLIIQIISIAGPSLVAFITGVYSHKYLTAKKFLKESKKYEEAKRDIDLDYDKLRKLMRKYREIDKTKTTGDSKPRLSKGKSIQEKRKRSRSSKPKRVQRDK